MPRPKNGDIVSVENRWDGIIGEVLSYDNFTLTLRQPSCLFFGNIEQPFSPVGKEEIQILTEKGVMKYMNYLFEKKMERLDKGLSEHMQRFLKIR